MNKWAVISMLFRIAQLPVLQKFSSRDPEKMSQSVSLLGHLRAVRIKWGNARIMLSTAAIASYMYGYKAAKIISLLEVGHVFLFQGIFFFFFWMKWEPPILNYKIATTKSFEVSDRETGEGLKARECIVAEYKLRIIKWVLSRSALGGEKILQGIYIYIFPLN